MKTSVLVREDTCSESVLRQQVDVGTTLSSLFTQICIPSPIQSQRHVPICKLLQLCRL